MGVLNLNKRIEDKKQKEYEQDVQRLSKMVSDMLAEQGYKIVALINSTPSGIVPIVGMVKLNDTEKESFKLRQQKDNAEQLAKNIAEGKSTPIKE